MEKLNEIVKFVTLSRQSSGVGFNTNNNDSYNMHYVSRVGNVVTAL